MKILNVVYNKPAFLSYHYECLKKYLNLSEPLEYYVIDNSVDNTITDKFRALASYLNVNYVRVPQNIHTAQDPSTRAGKSLDYGLQYLYNNFHCREVVMVCDSDLFLTDYYDPLRALGNNDLVGKSPINAYAYQQPEILHEIQKRAYYTNQFLIINFKKINANNISFLPCVLDGVTLDCGGRLNLFFKQNPEIRHAAVSDNCSITPHTIHTVPNHLRDFFANDITLKGAALAELVADVFVHMRQGSNWDNRNPDIIFNRERNVFKLLCGRLIEWNIPVNDPQNKHVISFSLYGDSPKYTYNAIINAMIADVVYPGWICRIHHDRTVPRNILSVLRSFKNVELVERTAVRNNNSRRLWRFYDASDPTVAVMISRDCDSWLSFREAFSVKKWILSDKGVHILRDHCYHSQKIMAGMFGIKRGAFTWMGQMCDAYTVSGDYDQGFLASEVYPKILDNTMVHMGVQYDIRHNHLPKGHFPDGGIQLESYPKVVEYIPGFDIERVNAENGFQCIHCGNTHQFFVGEMFNVLNRDICIVLSKLFPGIV
uniref:Uncharacterized protein n=1 Tax=viral metagenome TaxID=1070528 RepID=A0A6C0AJU3_9ZZZZ